MLELMNAHQLAAFGEADDTAEDLRTWLTTPYVVVERDIRVLERDGRLIGYADVDATRDEPPLWWCDVKVAPDVDAGEVVAELVAWLEERAVEGRLRVWTSEDDARIVDAFDALGFEPVRHSYRMEIDLDDELREPAWPAEIAVRTPRRRRAPVRLRRRRRGLAGHERPDRRDLRRVGALARRARLVRSLALVPRHAPATSWRGSRSAAATRSTRAPATSQPAGRPAGLAAPGSRRGAPAPLVRCVPRARPGRVARSASTHRASPARRASTSERACASTATRSFSSGRCGSRLSA